MFAGEKSETGETRERRAEDRGQQAA